MLKAHLWSGPVLPGLAGPLETFYREGRSVINLAQASFKALRHPACTRAEPRASKRKGHMAIQRWVWLGDRPEGTACPVTGLEGVLVEGTWLGTLRTRRSMGHGSVMAMPTRSLLAPRRYLCTEPTQRSKSSASCLLLAGSSVRSGKSEV